MPGHDNEADSANRRLLVLGLGNPEPRYFWTRHNIGFRVADHLAKRLGVDFRDDRHAWVTPWIAVPDAETSICLAKPTTYMNRSGLAASYLLDKYDLEPDDLLVICDDVNLPFGRLRLRPKGSDGGHNGLASVIEWLGTQEFPRLRIGIGANFGPGELVDYVLSDFTDEEEKLLPEIVQRAGDAVLMVAREGLEKAMSVFNR
ncbi:MAG: aminoacyl-tRNA hydrolase [Calditrichaeota bacterium]|nr:aminoacyl-tRNA hydrolase [Calditrichota bacterium]